MTYTTSPMGADHTSGNGLAFRNINHHDPLGKPEISRSLQVVCALLDTLGLCIFLRAIYLTANEAVVGMVNALHGTSLSGDDLQEIGRQVISKELEFNFRAGFKEPFNPIPEFMKTEPLSPHGSIWDVPDQELAAVWKDI